MSTPAAAAAAATAKAVKYTSNFRLAGMNYLSALGVQTVLAPDGTVVVALATWVSFATVVVATVSVVAWRAYVPGE